MNVRRLTLIALVSALLGLTACGGSSSSTTNDTTPTSTAGHTSSTGATTSTTAGPPKTVLTNGIYTAPDKTFTFRPNPEWESGQDGGQVYFATNADRTDTITIVGESLDGAPANLKDYVSVSLESAPDDIAGFKLLSRTAITLPSGDRAERLEYTGSVEDSPKMHFLMLVSISHSNAVTATFAAPLADFAPSVTTVEPILRTVDVR